MTYSVILLIYSKHNTYQFVKLCLFGYFGRWGHVRCAVAFKARLSGKVHTCRLVHDRRRRALLLQTLNPQITRYDLGPGLNTSSPISTRSARNGPLQP